MSSKQNNFIEVDRINVISTIDTMLKKKQLKTNKIKSKFSTIKPLKSHFNFNDNINIIVVYDEEKSQSN